MGLWPFGKKKVPEPPTFVFTDREAAGIRFFGFNACTATLRLRKAKDLSRWSSILAVNFTKLCTL